MRVSWKQRARCAQWRCVDYEIPAGRGRLRIAGQLVDGLDLQGNAPILGVEREPGDMRSDLQGLESAGHGSTHEADAHDAHALEAAAGSDLAHEVLLARESDVAATASSSSEYGNSIASPS